MPEPQVTIVVIPREQFSKAAASLDSILACTSPPYALVYVDGNSPHPVQTYVAERLRGNNFTLLQLSHYIPANEARNMAMRHVRTKYVVFVENDVVVSPNWLEPLIACAEETSASVVGPLYCMDNPKDQLIHTAGAEYRIHDIAGKPRVHERHFFCGKRVPEVQDQLRRQPIELVEFHCLLARTDRLSGMFDNGLLSYLDHNDFCLMIRAAGGSIYIEPQSVVTYLRPPPLSLSDVPFFLLRWSNGWLSRSINHFCSKHGLDIEDPHFKAHMEYQQQQRSRVLRHPRHRIRHLVGDSGLQKIESIIDQFCDGVLVRHIDPTRQSPRSS